MSIRFNFPYQTGLEISYIKDALKRGRLSGDGEYTKKCSCLLEKYLSVRKVLLTHSCTAALEMSAILANIHSGDEIIMPSYTFVSTANAFVLRGGIPVFVDIRPDTLNIDETKIEAAITKKTKAIVPVHYAGVACEMDVIMAIARQHNLIVIEDAAQALGSSYKGKKLGSIGDMATFSFHETKNIISGEGGALVVNNENFIERSEVIWEKGTNRKKFFRGEVDKYTWVDIGSSFLPSELVAAFLFGQLERIDEINTLRMEKWQLYHSFFIKIKDNRLKLPYIPHDCLHNAHMFYLQMQSNTMQKKILAHLKQQGFFAVFHYIPLHSTVAGKQYTRTSGSLKCTNKISDTIIRLPLYPNLTICSVKKINSSILSFLLNYKN